MRDDSAADTGDRQGLTDPAYWREFWDVAGVRIQPSRGGVRDHVRDTVVAELGKVVEPGSKWTEVGCASSTFLLDFPAVLGAELDGVDISARALEVTRSNLADLGVTPTLSCHDFTEPLPEELHAYDGVFSNGFVEHFADLSAVLVSVAKYVKPGGIVVSVIPNMSGIVGFLQLFTSSEIFLTHHVITPPILRQEMERAGLIVDVCEPFMSFNTGVVNVGERRGRLTGRALEAALVGTSRAVWSAERITKREMKPRLWRSPYLISVGRTT